MPRRKTNKKSWWARLWRKIIIATSTANTRKKKANAVCKVGIVELKKSKI
ncbi:hypothetical protein KAU19_05445 [Candidatus Parcubacteria bacterium]|nr:hypothetical protein [Candidatus Parcubacteria bacterium]